MDQSLSRSVAHSSLTLQVSRCTYPRRTGQVGLGRFRIWYSQRYRIFFFTGKSLTPLTHSFSEIFVFFFPVFVKKKIPVYFFFPRKSLKATHSAEGQLPKRNRYFCTFAVFFFFPTKINKNVYFFFSQEKFITHSLTRSQGPEKKKTGAEKKKHIFDSLTRFFPKSVDFQTFPGKKKNTIPLDDYININGQNTNLVNFQKIVIFFLYNFFPFFFQFFSTDNFRENNRAKHYPS